ncbi:MAG TPA: hypothetical protein VGT61_10975 [Thermomicrobiales bacterium]|nr:hypothetical protein [Thermomicrobiales bacterium]
MTDTYTPDGIAFDPHAAMIARIRRKAIEEMGGGDFPDLDACVERAVKAVGAGSVSAFVPLLALREVRCCIRAGTCACGTCR